MVGDVPETPEIGEMSSDDAESLLVELRGLRHVVNSLHEELARSRRWTRRMISVVIAAVLIVAGFAGGGVVYVNHELNKNNSNSCDAYRDLQELRPSAKSAVGVGILDDFGKLYEKYNCKPPLSEVLKQIQQEQAKK